MSNLIDVFDAIYLELATIYPDKVKLANPYSPQDNINGNIKNGYGLQVDSASPAESNFCEFRLEHGFNVILTREWISTSSNAGPLEESVRLLKEDAYTVQRAFYDVSKLDLGTQLDGVLIGSLSGVEFVNAGKFNFIYLTVGFEFSISEAL